MEKKNSKKTDRDFVISTLFIGSWFILLGSILVYWAKDCANPDFLTFVGSVPIIAGIACCTFGILTTQPKLLTKIVNKLN